MHKHVKGTIARRLYCWALYAALLVFLVPAVLVMRRWAQLRQAGQFPAHRVGNDAALFHTFTDDAAADMTLRAMAGTEILHGNRAKKQLALTFDDGPNSKVTPQLLAVLKWYHVKATFFLVGARVDANPELVKAEYAEGHCLGNHTYHHDRLTKIGPSEYRAEIRDCAQAIERATGQPPRFFRPPGGRCDAQVTHTAEQLGCQTVLWTVNPGDFRHPGSARIENDVIGGARNGAIILLHDGVQETVDALPNIIETLRGRGFRFVTLDEMIADQTK